jgi:hypothetical protein
MKRLTIATLITILISACGSFASNPNSTPTSTPAPEGTADATTDHYKLNGAVIIYQKSGGFAGVMEEWTIFPDGRIVSGDGHEYLLAEEQISVSLSEIENLGFFEISGPGQLLTDCRDCFTYKITVSAGGRTKVVNAVDDQSDPTEAIWAVINVIENLLSDL